MSCLSSSQTLPLCLESATSYYRMTTQMERKIHVLGNEDIVTPLVICHKDYLNGFGITKMTSGKPITSELRTVLDLLHFQYSLDMLLEAVDYYDDKYGLDELKEACKRFNLTAELDEVLAWLDDYRNDEYY